MKNGPYLSLVAIWTITSLVTMYGSLGSALARVESMAPLLHSSNNVVTRLFIDVHASDWFITVGSLANTLVLAWLAVEVLRPLRFSWRLREAMVEPAVGPAMGEWVLVHWRDGNA